MPRVSIGEISLACEEQGQGNAVLLIAGGFMDMDQWDAQVAALSQDRRVIRYAQRGVGESDKPTTGYSIADFTRDAAALIDALDAAPVVAFGASLGGLVALELALTQPAKVCALILAATSAGVRGVPMPAATQQEMFRGAALPLEQAAAALQGVVFHTDYPQRHPEILTRAIAKRRDHPAPIIATLGPIQSAMAYDAFERLPQIRVPTLVLHGEEDRIVPVGNAALLAERIPGARRVTIPNAGHGLTGESAEAVSAAVRDFLAAIGD